MLSIFDKDGDGPFHFLARTDHDESEAVDVYCWASKTAMDIWIERNKKEDDEGASRLRHHPDW